jgi:hypothetical protein
VRRAVAIAIAALAVAAPAASAPQAPLRVVGFSQIGAFHVRGGTPARARTAFGAASKTQEIRSRSCRLTWPGLTISFYTLASERQCGPRTPFGEARITRAWITDRGLRRGDTVARARRLYPDARKSRPAFSGPHGVGLIVKLSQAVGDYGLAAVAVGGRLTTLVISDPQGGE